MIVRRTSVLPPEPPAALAQAWRAAVRVRMRDPERGRALCRALWALEWRWHEGTWAGGELPPTSHGKPVQPSLFEVTR